MQHNVAFSFADGKTLFFKAKHNELLLDAALRNGITIPLDCREGVCGTCKGRCESGRYEQDYVDEEALTEQELAERAILTCQTRVHSAASFYYDFDSSLCSQDGTQTLQATVTSVQQVSPTTAILHLDASTSSRLDYLPGQYARIRIPDLEGEVWRSYSFATCPNDSNQLQFLIRLLPSGAMSDYIRHRCQPGQLLTLEAPFGAFYRRHVSKPLYMLAGGTGLSAFLGMLDELAEQGGCGQPVTLYYGVTTEADLCELERLQRYVTRIPGFSWHAVVMKPAETWQGKRGVIPDHLDVSLLQGQPFDMYMCGPPPMVEAVRQWLSQQEITGGQLYFEKFVESNSKD
ncbi:anthranilate dioxygenase reductase [Pokkaliibacter plantistimulans]|uniref:Anthranilate dioxygenase reductase n=1 Tax=Proteobacteria bacterium 228 TaxID=2083153 RepID=A0A2S5KKL0_9PROT|nr:anthranilate 1,2-dioxygenase electron transfer component AntC [Pokkaliibacter plantistimulans]PPC75173.1 anthranilate dioxygenase reductase [Pokkaliibacter plantistimulans]